MHLRIFSTPALVLLAGLLSCLPVMAQEPTPPYPTLSSVPDPRDFFGRADTHLTLLGNPQRLAGADLDWLGLRSDASQPGQARLPTDYEVNDALLTVQALGGTVVRARTLGASVGCALCLMPAPGRMGDAAFAQADMVLGHARDLGLKLIVPLAGGPQDCGRPDPYDGSICFFVRARGQTSEAAFFSDPGIRADFLAYVTAVVSHVNATTGESYAENPAIMAWENCDGCGRGIDAGVLSSWSEAVGQAIRAADTRHLYEDGAFAGRIDPHAPGAAPASAWATPSVDIVGDSVPPGDASAAAVAVSKADRVYMIDALGWSPRAWKTLDDFEAELDTLARQRLISGALIAGLQGHADSGGFLPPSARNAFYFPGLDTALTSAADMQARGRAFRRFAYRMAELPPPAFLLAPKPEIISAVHGRLTWRGSAGAYTYQIERATDLVAPGAWSLVCASCSETAQPWQDPHVPAGPVWYRIVPVNVNDHASPPSAPFRNQP
jgi:hypothetical protein